jgi:hypothetical protein
MPPSQFDPFGTQRFAQIQADVAAINAKLATVAAGVASINAKVGPLLAAVNAPAWLTPSVPATLASVPAEAVAAAVYYPPVVDVGGQIYSLLNQIITTLGAIAAAISGLGSGVSPSDSAALAQALAGIATASAALTAAVSAHGAPPT